MNRAGLPCDDDRMSAVRRVGEGAPELESFLEHLRICDDCWRAWLTWRCLEPEGAVQSGDEQIIARAANRALRAWRRDQPNPRRATRAAAAAAVLLIGTMASAGIFEYQRRAGRPAETPLRPHATTGHRTTAKESVPARQATVTESPLPSAENLPRPLVVRRSEPWRPATAMALPPAPTRLAAVEPPPLEPSVPLASALFTEATEARRNGRIEAATEAFRRLQAEFPLTPEATVSLVSLAELLAKGDAPAAALPLFDAYLASSPAGPLYPEALVGKARVLDRLGRPDQARAVRLEIGRRTSGSLYVPAR